MSEDFTQKDQLRILEKMIKAIHGESKLATTFVMVRLLTIDYSDLTELKKKYIERMKSSKSEKI